LLKLSLCLKRFKLLLRTKVERRLAFTGKLENIMSPPGKRKLVDSKINSHFGGQLKQRHKTQMELYLLREKAKLKTKAKTSVDPRTLDSWFGGTGSTTGTVTPKSSLPSARTYPQSDDEVTLVKVKASPPKKDGKPRSFRQEAQEESKQRSLSDEENIPAWCNRDTATLPATAAAHIPAVAAKMSQPRVSPSVIDLTDDSAHPSPASFPVQPPPATYYTLAEFKSMWNMAEEDGRYSIEEIEQGSLVRSGNSKVEVRENTDTCMCRYSMMLYISFSLCGKVKSSCLETMHRLIDSLLAWYTVKGKHSPLMLCASCMHSFLLDGR
jgi:hypothetical protein